MLRCHSISIHKQDILQVKYAASPSSEKAMMCDLLDSADKWFIKSTHPVEVRVVDTERCKQGEDWEWVLHLWAQRWSSRWCRWQVWSSLGITLHSWYSDCTMCDISALISDTHHTARKVPWTWMAFEIDRSNITKQTVAFVLYSRQTENNMI